MLNALSIDVEEWYHPELVRAYVDADRAQSQLEASLRPILNLLKRYDVRATFFVVGEVIESAPDLIREIAVGGHEIGCHGMTHRPLHELQPDGLRAELMAYERAITSAGIEQVVGFRAPTFSLDNETRWAVPILAEFGYEYDASIFPMRNYLYGVPDCPPTPYRIGGDDVTRPDPRGCLWEFPMSAGRLGWWRIPASGGFYLRIMPFFILRILLARINARGWPFVIYLHPWETYTGTPRLRELSWLSRWITYTNIERTLPKLERLLAGFPLSTMREALACWQERYPGIDT